MSVCEYIFRIVNPQVRLEHKSCPYECSNLVLVLMQIELDTRKFQGGGKENTH